MTTPNTAPTPTAARTKPRSDSHWYSIDGVPRYEIAKKDGSGMRSTTLADARKNNYLPSVTTVLKILHKEGLVRWMLEQTALAVLTTPRNKDEADDAFVKRVLVEEEQQEQEGKAARDLGKDIHDGLECFWSGEEVPAAVEVYCRPVIDALLAYGEKASSEVILVGDDFAGMTDLIMDCESHWRMVDFKSAKNMPDPARGGAWLEHRLQLAAYARAFLDKLKRAGDPKQMKPILVMNVYISTTNPGQYVVCEHEDWESAYEAFAALVKVWQWQNHYRPENPKRMPSEDTVKSAMEVELKALVGTNARLAAEVSKLQAELAAAKNVTQPIEESSVLPAAAATVAEAIEEDRQRLPAGLVARAPDPIPPNLRHRAAPGLPTQIEGKKIKWTPGIPSVP